MTKPIIAFGGINNNNLISSLLAEKCVSAIGIGNMLNYKELSVEGIKKYIINKDKKHKDIIRPGIFNERM